MTYTKKLAKWFYGISGLISLCAPHASFAGYTASIAVSAMVLYSCQLTGNGLLSSLQQQEKAEVTLADGINCNGGTTYTVALDHAVNTAPIAVAVLENNANWAKGNVTDADKKITITY